MARYSTKLKSKAKPKRNLMPLWLSLAGLGFILIAVWAVLGSSQPKANIEVQGEPRLKVEADKIDRGDIKLGTPIRDDIRVTNVGDRTLRFMEAPIVQTKEGC
jgi:hypothetical protein